MQNPTDTHWKVVKRVLRYLQGTKYHGLHLKASNEMHFTAFSNADWASDPDDRRSISAYLVFLGNSLISWASRK